MKFIAFLMPITNVPVCNRNHIRVKACTRPIAYLIKSNSFLVGCLFFLLDFPLCLFLYVCMSLCHHHRDEFTLAVNSYFQHAKNCEGCKSRVSDVCVCVCLLSFHFDSVTHKTAFHTSNKRYCFSS